MGAKGGWTEGVGEYLGQEVQRSGGGKYERQGGGVRSWMQKIIIYLSFICHAHPHPFPRSIAPSRPRALPALAAVSTCWRESKLLACPFPLGA